MKKEILICGLLLITAPGLAEEQTLLGQSSRTGWYFASTYKFSTMNQEFVRLSGWRAVMIFDKTWSLGLAGTDTDSKDIPAPVTHKDQAVYMDLNYHGFELGYIWNSDRVAHCTADLLVALGSVGYKAQGSGKKWNRDLVAVIEPTVQLELNVVRWMRIGLGAGYRFVTAIDLEGLSSGDVSGPTGVLTFKFGRFQ
ncbi:MAG TPA: hypothetical protein ENN17_10055 [bacterium]|nr:hypothetical protein [bacterium]